MDVGETVVVGTSRLKGGAKALIAPPHGRAAARDDGAERVGSGLKAQGSGKIFDYLVERFCLSPEP